MNILVKKATDGENLSLPRRLIDCESVSKKEFWGGNFEARSIILYLPDSKSGSDA